MPSAAIIRHQIETSLSQRIPSALTPSPRTIRPVTATGISSIDAILEGGLPVGGITEVVGPECSGRTAFALSFVARLTQSGTVCAWVDVSDTLHPESAAASGVDLLRLLWIRCGISISAPESRRHKWRSLFQRNISILRRSRKACTAAASVPILAMKLKGSPIPLAVLCNRKRSPRDAQSRSAECNRNGRSSNRICANHLHNHIESLPRFANRGQGSNRPSVSPIFFCRAEASARLSWTWAASLPNMPCGCRLQRGSVIVRQRSEHKSVFFY